MNSSDIGATYPVSSGLRLVIWLTWLYRGGGWLRRAAGLTGNCHCMTSPSWPKICCIAMVSPGSAMTAETQRGPAGV